MMNEEPTDHEEEDESGEEVCPICRTEMEVVMLQSRYDSRIGLGWARCCWECSQCGHRSKSWDVVD